MLAQLLTWLTMILIVLLFGVRVVSEYRRLKGMK